MEPRNQFTFYRSFYDAISDLPKTQQAATILAVCAYALYEEEPQKLPRASMACFKLMKPVLDAGRAKAENGAKGGKANGKQNESSPEADSKQAESKTKAKGKQPENKKEVEIKKEIKKEIANEIEVDVDVERKVEATSPDAAATRDLRLIGGQLGKGVVALSEDQSADLLEKLGLDMFEYYVKKLADFIIKKNANVKNHYETILKWWREDSHLEEESNRKEIR